MAEAIAKVVTVVVNDDVSPVSTRDSVAPTTTNAGDDKGVPIEGAPASFASSEQVDQGFETDGDDADPCALTKANDNDAT